MVTVMLISLDANVWIFALLGTNIHCEKISVNLSRFNVIIPNQVRMEVERNLSQKYVKRFYNIALKSGIEFNFERVPELYITMFESKGLKKGDAIIGGFGEWQKIDILVSDNRDFLRGLSAEHYFAVVSPQEFCKKFGL